MKPADRNLIVALLLAIVALLPPSARGQDRTRALLAAGTEEQFWSADVVPSAAADAPGAVLTTIRLRSPGDQLRWQPMAELAEAPVALATRGSELLVVLANGEWKIVRAGDIRSGIPLPGNARVMALAGDDDDNVWAIGGLDPARRAATSTRPATATAPALSQAAPPRTTSTLALLVLRRGVWTLVSDVPVQYKPEQVAAISLAVIDGTLMLAIVGPDRAVRVHTRRGEQWSDISELDTLNDAAQMKLIAVRGRPALWLADPGSSGRLYYGGEDWQSPVRLETSPKLENFDRRALAYALGQLRMLATDGKGRIIEQLHNPDGTLLGEASEAYTTSTDLQRRVWSIIQFIIMAALLAWMVGSLRQRPNLAEVISRIEKLQVAPLGLRLAGGVIDALPLIGGVIASAIFASHSNVVSTGRLDLASPEVASLCAGVGLYFLHITLFEVLMGRSLGKLIAGTRVATLDGSTPYVSQILARNALRLIDLILLGVPLLAILQSPLRQRVGDMMGGTTVVMNTAPPIDLKSSDESPPGPPPPPDSV